MVVIGLRELIFYERGFVIVIFARSFFLTYLSSRIHDVLVYQFELVM